MIDLRNCDCFELLATLPDKSVDIIYTDPPYFQIMKDDWDNQWKNMYDYQKWVEKLSDEFHRVLKDNGSFYWWGDDKNIAYSQVIFDKNFNLLNNLVWNKTNSLNKKGAESIYRSYAPITERCLFYDRGEDMSGLEMINSNKDCFLSIKTYMRAEKEKVKEKFNLKNEKEFAEYINEITDTRSVVARHYFADSQYSFPTQEIYKKLQKTGFFAREYEDLRAEYEDLRRVWNNDAYAYDIISNNYELGDRFHPCQKPVKLIEYMLSRSSKKGHLVLDMFSGSGTTAMACKKLGLDFVGCELDQKFYDASIKRIEASKPNMEMDFEESDE